MSQEPAQRVALVTGGNRGIGFEVCRQLAKQGYKVLLASRSPEKGREAAMVLAREGGEVLPLTLDVTREESIVQARQSIERTVGRLDVLVNCAGVLLSDPAAAGAGQSVLKSGLSTIRESLETNTFGPLRLIQEFVPLMQKNGYGRIVNVSSGMGQLSDMNGGYPGYRLSKVSLNAITRIVADELKGSTILINSVCPGWVKTELGGPQATRNVAEGADTIVWLATLPTGGPSGGFFRDRTPIPW